MKDSRWRAWLPLVVATAALACQPIPEAYPDREESLALPPARRAALRRAMDSRFGTPKALRVPAELDLDAARVIAGQRAFKDLCAVCHGVLGDGDGLVVDDRGGARDFRRAVFKFTSTASPTPTRTDIERSVRLGLPGTRMAAFEDEPPAELDAAIDYLCFIAQRGAVERRLIAELDDDEADPAELMAEVLEAVAADWRGAPDRVLAPSIPFPPASEDQVARGRGLYLSERAQCVECHGSEGEGDGRRAKELRDDFDRPIAPADLTEGEFRGGDRPIDLYYRIAGGIPGTPMPAMRSALSDEEIWAIVHFVKSLSADD